MPKKELKVISTAIHEQYGAAIQMLENVVSSCPEEVWDERTSGPPFWQVAYHTMWYLDWYLAGSREERENFTPKYDKGLENLREVPDNTLSSKQIISYLNDIKRKARERLEFANLEELSHKPVFEWHGNSILSSMIYNIRHVMLHIGALNSRLLRKGLELKNWVSQSPILIDNDSKC